MKVSVFPGGNCLSEWLRSFKSHGLEYDVLSLDGIKKVPSEKTSAVVFLESTGIQLRNSITQVLVNCFDLGIPAYPDLRSHVLYNDKVTQSTEFSRLGIPAPETHVFWEEEDALEWLESSSYPVVSKTSGGAGSGGVSLLGNSREARRVVRNAFSRGRRVDSYPPETTFPIARSGFRWLVSESPLSSLPFSARLARKHSTLRSSPFRERDFVLFQRYLPGNEFDYRITVIGDKAFGMRRFNRSNDFRASGSDIQDMNPDRVPGEVVETAFQTADKLGMNRVMAADILMDGNRPSVVEVSYLFANSLKEYPGYWDRNCSWQSHACSRISALTDLFAEEIRQSCSRDHPVR